MESPSSPKVQAVIKRHYDAIKRFWVPDQNSYIGLTRGYVEFKWKQPFQKYDANHPELPKVSGGCSRDFC